LEHTETSPTLGGCLQLSTKEKTNTLETKLVTKERTQVQKESIRSAAIAA